MTLILFLLDILGKGTNEGKLSKRYPPDRNLVAVILVGCDVEMTKSEDSHNEIVVKIPLLTFKFDPVNFPLYELGSGWMAEIRAIG